MDADGHRNESATSPQPNGFPSPPQDSCPKNDERSALSGPPEAERVTDGVVQPIEPASVEEVLEQPEVEVPNRRSEMDELTEGERNGDYFINRAGNPR